MLGKLLIRLLLKERGVPLDLMAFAKTDEGKPYVTTSGLGEPLGYNITHDNGCVAMAFATGEDLYPNPPAYRLGIDVMRLQHPDRTTYPEFVESISEQLTTYELTLLQDPYLDMDEAIRRFFLIWTLKEAYSKALGSGMSMDFKEIEYDVPRDVVRIEGRRPIGWKFVRTEIERGGDRYVVVVVKYIGELDHARGDCVVERRPAGDWLKVWDAASILQRAMDELK